MTHVVTEPCFNCRHTRCVLVCPCDSFREGDAMLFIDPESCIDCEACTAECPTSAIFLDDNVPVPWKDYIDLNAEMAAVCPEITDSKAPLQA